MQFRIALILIVVLSSCSLFRNKVKTKEKVKTDSISETRSAFHLVDTGYTLTREMADSVLHQPEQVVERLMQMDQYRPFSVVVDSGRVRLELDYNPATKTLRAKATAKATEQHLKVDKTVLEKKGLTVTGSKEAKTELKKTAINTTTDTKPNSGFLWIVAVISCLIIGRLLFLHLRK
ncbi:hypothetical protein KHS38_11740 [Mucilaginibacter sp. Bleaf8]|uniref:hypothetical protein n=1 Tax=Mucilaginibacter sp. Bleaf8 TaxID=2834430 RepID=UPI001BCCD351|nr:hypothetical protein [Mucilaginibacter sp. Bleaf8]MBS7565077.1 hypothetical protein [Mucilaginibacter sp. Bleaf8]